MQANPDSNFARAVRLEAEGKLEQAAAIYQQILSTEPEHVEALYRLGTLCLTSGHLRPAIQWLEQASSLDTGHAHARLSLARAYRQDGRSEPAFTTINQALALQPSDPLILIESGHLHSDQNSNDQAIAAYQQALSVNPECIDAYYSLSFLVQTGDYHFTEPECGQLERLLEQVEDLPLLDQSLLHFIYGRILHKNGRFDTAFNHFNQANQARKACQNDWERFNPTDKQTLLQHSREIFPDCYPFTDIPAPLPLKPVFIIGMPRTGSTLLESCLARHPEIAAAGELATIKNIARQQLPQATGKNYPMHIPELPAPMAQAAARFVVQQLRSKATDEHHQAGNLTSRVIDKMPTNFEYLGLIAKLFPQAYIIHISRDPMDTLWSCYQQNIAARYSNDLHDLEAQYRCYRQFMDLWQQLGIPMLEVRYERLVSDIETTLKQVIEYLDLNWDSNCLQNTAPGSAVNTASRMQVRKPVHTGAIGAWKKYAQPLTELRQRLADFYPD